MPIRTIPVTEAKAKLLELVTGVNERDDEVRNWHKITKSIF